MTPLNIINLLISVIPYVEGRFAFGILFVFIIWICLYIAGKCVTFLVNYFKRIIEETILLEYTFAVERAWCPFH